MKPLLGKTILITRGKQQAKEFSEKITAFGGHPIELPLISFASPQDFKDIEQAFRQIKKFDWIIFTSKNGVEYFFKHFMKLEISENVLTKKKFAVVGKKTEQALKDKGYQASIIPKSFVAEELLEALKGSIVAGEQVLLARGNLGRSILPEGLVSLGAKVTDLVVYENVIDESTKNELILLLKENKIDVITFLSPSAVNNFIKLLNGSNWQKWIQACKIACIGPITKKQVLAHKLPVHICPAEYTVQGMLEAINLSLME